MTLLELVAVLVIVAVALAAAAPSLRGFAQSRQTASTARSLVSLAAWARAQAISEGRPYRLHVDVDERVYYVTARQGGTFAPIETSLGRTFDLSDQLTVEWDGPEEIRTRGYITFYPTGRLTPGTLIIGDRSELVTILEAAAPTDRFVVVAENQLESQARRRP